MKIYTARQVWETKRIYWITSYKALLQYISHKYRHILKPVEFGSKSGKRYYLKEENITEFIRRFEKSELK